MFCRICGYQLGTTKTSVQKCPRCGTPVLKKNLLSKLDESGYGGCLYAPLFVALAVLVVVLAVKLLGGIGFLIGLELFSVLIILFGSIILRVADHLKKCPHGIRGGQKHGKCFLCLQQKIYEEHVEKERLERERLAEIECRRLAEIKNRADMLFYEELRAYKRARLKELDYLLELSPYEFEDVVLEMFSKLGYSVQSTPYSNDRGKDGIVYLNGKKYLIECKRFSRNVKPTRPMLQKFFAAIYEEKAQGGFFVTTSFFPKTAFEYASKHKIKLVNGYRLVEMMSEAYPEKK